MNVHQSGGVSEVNMRTNLVKLLLVAATLASPAVAAADAADSLVGRYDVTFEQVTSNCQSAGLTLTKDTMIVSKRAPGIAVEVPKVALMTGAAAKAGRLKASSKLGKTSMPALDGKFSIVGTVDDAGKLDAVFVAEFYADGKPSCTQSWSATGTRLGNGNQPLAPAPTATFTTFGRETGLPPISF